MYLNSSMQFNDIIFDASHRYKFVTILIEYESFSKLFDFDKQMLICFSNEPLMLDEIRTNMNNLLIICDFRNQLVENNSESNILRYINNIMCFDIIDITPCLTDVIMHCAELSLNVISVYRSDLDKILARMETIL